MRTLLIGDIHGDMDGYRELIKNSPKSIQLGDFGWGFCKSPTLASTHRAIRGNHDNPAKAKLDPIYLGDFGVYEGMFFISGAYSIDKAWRTPGWDWWDDEELNVQQLMQAIVDCIKLQPKIIITHASPESIKHRVLGDSAIKISSRTEQALEVLFQQYQPEEWYFAHLHKPYQEIVNGTKFRCLDCYETCEI